MNRILFSPDVTDASGANSAAASPVLTAAQQRANAIREYYEATTREAKAAVVKKYPELADVFSAGNHS